MSKIVHCDRRLALTLLLATAWGCSPTTEPGAGLDSGGTGPTQLSDDRDAQPVEPTVAVADRAGYDAVISRHQGKVVLVDFWATWCGPCRAQFPHTVELSRKYSADEMAVVTVSMDDVGAKADVLSFLVEHQAGFDNLLSSYGIGQTGFEAFELGDGGVPHYKVIDRQSVVRHSTNDSSELDAWIEQLINEG